jgi:hypothetical protein
MCVRDCLQILRLFFSVDERKAPGSDTYLVATRDFCTYSQSYFIWTKNIHWQRNYQSWKKLQNFRKEHTAKIVSCQTTVQHCARIEWLWVMGENVLWKPVNFFFRMNQGLLLSAKLDGRNTHIYVMKVPVQFMSFLHIALILTSGAQ